MKSYFVRGAVPDKVQEALKVFPEYTRHLLYHRGIEDHDSAEAFLNPNFDLHTHNPFLLKDMDRAVERIYQAIKSNERITIFSDYDADGIPGGAVLHDFFKKIGYSNFSNYIPHRHHEGFGLNVDAIDSFAEQKTRLLITVDCGIADAKEVAHAKKLGMETIITDHHEVHGEMPDAYAVIDPKQADCNYPDKNLCGAALAWKLVSAFLQKHSEEFDVSTGWEKWLLDLVGMATLSDMVPLTGENRTLAYYGLTVLRKTPRPGLNSLFGKLRINKKYLTEDDIGFSITPRINAASRMDKPEDAFRLLVTDDPVEAQTLADHLDHINNERKGTVASLVKEIKKIIAERYKEDKKVIVIGNPLWRPALLGLAANSFANEYSCPVFLWGRDGDGLIKGSCRSGGSVSVLALMQKTKDSFIAFGGHVFSGGFEVSHENIHGLGENLSKAFDELKNSEPSVARVINVDYQLSIEDITWQFFDEINSLSPFGVGNEKPFFMFKDVKPVVIKTFGKASEHLELIFKKKSGETISVIGFFMKQDSFKSMPVVGETLDLVAQIEKSTFRRRPELRLRIVDII